MRKARKTTDALGTQGAALKKIDKATLRAGVLRALRATGDGTAEEIACWMHYRGYDIGCDRQDIQPRCTELEQFGQIEKTGERRRNRKSGNTNCVYRLAGGATCQTG